MNSKLVYRIPALVVALALIGSGLCAAKSPKAKAAFNVRGMYFEGCSCHGPCPCILTGPAMGCEGVGMYSIKHGTFMGKDLSGVKTAYALGLGNWVKVYIDAPASKQAAATAFMKAMLKDFGPFESARAAKISISGSNGKYRGAVDGGKVMKISTVVVLGGDGKTPVTYGNVNDPVSPTVMQGKT